MELVDRPIELIGPPATEGWCPISGQIGSKILTQVVLWHASATAFSSALPCAISFLRFKGLRLALAPNHCLRITNHRGSGATMRAGVPSRHVRHVVETSRRLNGIGRHCVCPDDEKVGAQQAAAIGLSQDRAGIGRKKGEAERTCNPAAFG